MNDFSRRVQQHAAQQASHSARRAHQQQAMHHAHQAQQRALEHAQRAHQDYLRRVQEQHAIRRAVSARRAARAWAGGTQDRRRGFFRWLLGL